MAPYRNDQEEEIRLSYFTRYIDDVSIIDLIGELDMYTLPLAQDLIDNLIANKKYKILFNLSKLKYIDSSGLGFFTGTLKSVQKHNGDLKLCSVSSYVHRIFSINHLDYFIDIFNNVQEGIDSFKHYGEIAVEKYRKALQINPNYADAHYNLGMALKNNGQLDEALDEIEKALMINPSYIGAYLLEGNIHKQMNNTQDAEKALKKAFELDSANAEVLYQLGMLYNDSEKYHDALSQYLEAVNLNPGYPDLRNKVGSIYLSMKNYDEAIIHLSKAVEINPRYVDAIFNLAHAYIARGMNNQAIDELRKIVAMNLNNEKSFEAKKLLDSLIVKTSDKS